MKLTEQLLIEKGFEFDDIERCLVKHKEENSLLLIYSFGFYYPVLSQIQDCSTEQEQRVSLQRITDLKELETIWALFTGGTL